MAEQVQTTVMEVKPKTSRKNSATLSTDQFLAQYGAMVTNTSFVKSNPSAEKQWGQWVIPFMSPFGAGQVKVWMSKELKKKDKEEVKSLLLSGKLSVILSVSDGGLYDFESAIVYETKASGSVETFSMNEDKPHL